MVDINAQNFQQEVLDPSYKQPVVLDFYATWCGPCQLLKPLLEKLAHEYNYILAKVDIDQNPDLANYFGVEGVPDIRIVTQGQMKEGFVGVLSEKQLRQFLSENLQFESSFEKGIADYKEAFNSGNIALAKEILDRLYQEFPNDIVLTLESAKFLVKLKQMESALQLIETIEAQDKTVYTQAQGLKTLINYYQESQTPMDEIWDKPFQMGIIYALKEDYSSALDSLLNIVENNRKYRGDSARKAMIAIFNLLGNNNKLTQEYQKQLTLILF